MGTARSVARGIAPTCLRPRSAKSQEVLPFPKGEGGGGTTSDEGPFQSCYAARRSRALRENRFGRGVLGTPAGARSAPLPQLPRVGTPALQTRERKTRSTPKNPRQTPDYSLG